MQSVWDTEKAMPSGRLTAISKLKNKKCYQVNNLSLQLR